MFTNYKKSTIYVNGVNIHFVIGGSGPPLLLLHGYPQTHVIWHKVADALAERYTVVAADLRGYGDSSKPDGLADHSNYSKRETARDQVEVMRQLGYESFYVVGHDRGARVGYRMALDFPQTVKQLMVLDIVPTLLMYEKTDMAFAQAYYHWFFLIQAKPFPEEMIAANLSFYLEKTLFGLGRTTPPSESPFTPGAMHEYLRCLELPNAIHAVCEDYRAGASVDLEHDRKDRAAGNRITCDVRVLWGAHGVIDRLFDPLNDWKTFATNVYGRSLPCGHFIPEEVPDMLLEEIVAFFR